jgi:hypothetical protein
MLYARQIAVFFAIGSTYITEGYSEISRFPSIIYIFSKYAEGKNSVKAGISFKAFAVCQGTH